MAKALACSGCDVVTDDYNDAHFDQVGHDRIKTHATRYNCSCGIYSTDDFLDAHFAYPGHEAIEVEPMMGANIFDVFPSEEVVVDHMAQPGVVADSEPATATDGEAMDTIAHILSGEEWDADTLGEVAEVVRASGRVVEEI